MKSPATLLHLLFAALLLLLLSAACAGDELASPEPSPPQKGCAAEVLGISACLPLLAPQPGDALQEPSAACCDAFRSAINRSASSVSCVCHLVRRPSLLGFPVSTSGIYSLFPACVGSSSKAFEESCRGSETLPPLGDPTPSEIGLLDTRRHRLRPPRPPTHPAAPPHSSPPKPSPPSDGDDLTEPPPNKAQPCPPVPTVPSLPLGPIGHAVSLGDAGPLMVLAGFALVVGYPILLL